MRFTNCHRIMSIGWILAITSPACTWLQRMWAFETEMLNGLITDARMAVRMGRLLLSCGIQLPMGADSHLRVHQRHTLNLVLSVIGKTQSGRTCT